MMERQMTALEDGGIVVLAANQLIKYDSNLDLVKQTELKVDMQQMQEQMKKMMQNCPMCQTMMQNSHSVTRRRSIPSITSRPPQRSVRIRYGQAAEHTL